MNDHRQFCGVALAANTVLDHWSPLLLRELLIAPRRFGELKAALGPVAPNLLSTKLRELAAAGLVERVAAVSPSGSPPALRGGREAVAIYRLTALGESFRPVMHALIRWSKGLFATVDPSGDWGGEPHWLLLSVPALLAARPESLPAWSFGLEVEGLGMRVDCRPGEVPTARVLAGAEDGLPCLSGPYKEILAFFAGALPARPRPTCFAWRGSATDYRRLAALVKAQAG